MKRTYSIFASMVLASLLHVGAQNQFEKYLDLESPQTSVSLKSEQIAPTLRNTQDVVQHDSALIYSNAGKIIGKEYFFYKDEGRDVTSKEYAIVDSLNLAELTKDQRTIYDDKGNVIFSSQVTNPNTSYGAGNKSEYVFNDRGVRIASSYYIWNSHKRDWILRQNSKYNIFPKGYETTQESFQHDPLGELIYGYKTVSTADSTNLITTEFAYLWNLIEKRWVDYEVFEPNEGDSVSVRDLGYSRISYLFDNENRITKRITTKIRKNAPITPEIMTEYIYNSDGDLKELIVYWAKITSDSTSTQIGWTFASREVYEYDAQKNRILYETYNWEDEWLKQTKIESKFDTRNLETERIEYHSLIDKNTWIPYKKTISNFDSQLKLISSALYKWDGDSEDNGYWIGNTRYIYRYTGNLRTYSEAHLWDIEEQDWRFYMKELTELDSNQNPAIIKTYFWEGDEWNANYIKIYYPYAPSQDLVIEETKPINNDRDENNFNGKFTLALNIASDAIPSGSFDIVLPQGFTLNLNETKLASDISSKAQATFTDKGNNIWTVTITEKTLRSSSSLVYKNILDVVYTVSENVATQKHEIVLKDMELSLSTGGIISKEEMKVTVAPKNVSSLEEEVQTIDVYLADGLLNINTPQNEVITIYSLLGQTLIKTVKQEGNLAIDVQDLAKGIIIVNGSSNWKRKLIVK